MTIPKRSFILQRIRWSRDHTREKLLSKMDMLTLDINRCMKALRETGKPDNSLGIIQGQASEIDRLCGELARLNEVIAIIEGEDIP